MLPGGMTDWRRGHDIHSRTLDFLSLDTCLRICCSIECNMWDAPLIPRGEFGPFGMLSRCQRADIQRRSGHQLIVASVHWAPMTPRGSLLSFNWKRAYVGLSSIGSLTEGICNNLAAEHVVGPSSTFSAAYFPIYYWTPSGRHLGDPRARHFLDRFLGIQKLGQVACAAAQTVAPSEQSCRVT